MRPLSLLHSAPISPISPKQDKPTKANTRIPDRGVAGLYLLVSTCWSLLPALSLTHTHLMEEDRHG